MSIGSNTKMKKAWDIFLEQGLIEEDTIRPEVAASWQRSRGIDPFSKHRHHLPNRILQSKLADKVQLISLTRPIMRAVSEVEGHDFVVLSDQEGYIVEVAGDIKYSDLLGQRFSEGDIGTNAIGTALVDNRAIEIRGPEHYCACNHNTYGAAVPIHNIKEDIIGVLAAYNVSAPLPAGVMAALKLGVKVIENQINYRSELSEITHIYHNTCSSIIDFFSDGFLVVDAQENIININQSCMNMMGISDRESHIGDFLGNIIAGDRAVINRLLSGNPNEFINKFSLRGVHELVPCSLVRRRITKNPDGSQQTVLGFVAEGNHVEADQQTAISAVYGLDTSSISSLVGHSEKWNEIKKLALRAARVSSSVLIEGESGTGKELVAHAIHDESGLKGPFVAINCGAIPKELLQSELFGYEEGSFTGARKGGGIGKLEMGDGGTVFLDEIGEMPFDMQVNLLRFLQDKMITRIGSSTPKKVEVRIIAATNRKLKSEVQLGRFREDLYYRLNVINIDLPPLRERKLDIPPITRYFVQTLCHQFNRELLSISDAAMNLLCAYNWPGNVRELRNVIENAIVFAEGNIISEDILPSYLKSNPGTAESKPEAKHPDQNIPEELRGLTIEAARKLNRRVSADTERNEILRLLDEYRGNISNVARHMGLSRNTVYRKMRAYKIDL
jgi:sigma-54 dependent transcriptional regulator, acetoin dehydrogenase operon transcriptional activator AcoR